MVKGVGAEVDAGRLLAWRFPGALGDPDGQALWTHATFLLEAQDDVGLDALDAVAEKVTSGGDRGPRYGEIEPVALRISLDSAVAYRKPYGHIAACVARMVGVHTVVWGAAVDLDRRLLSVGAQPRAESLRGLEGQLERMLTASEHVRRVRGELDSVAGHLSALDGALWRAYLDKWGLATQLASIDAKLQAQEHVLAERTSVTTNRRARALSTLALAFTVASIVGVVSGLVTLTSVRLRWPTGPNLWFVAAIIGLAVALFLLLSSVALRAAERPQRPRDT